MLQIPQAVQVLNWFDALTEDQQKTINLITEESIAADEANKTLLLDALKDCGIDIESWRSVVKDADYDIEKWVDDVRQTKSKLKMARYIDGDSEVQSLLRLCPLPQ